MQQISLSFLFLILIGINAYSMPYQGEAFTDPYQHKQAIVRLDSNLCTQEKDFIKNRSKLVKPACERLLTKSLWSAYVPKIALCFSGGGYRAMIESIGSLIGADAIGLLDATMYVGGLSGSTWALAPWIFSGKNIKDYKERLKPKIHYNFSRYIFNLTTDERLKIYDLKEKKYADGHHFGLVNVYGALLANVLLDGMAYNKQDVHLSDLAYNVGDGSYPLPICTAVAGGVGNHHLWFAFTPFEIGSSQTGFVPTWAFGRTFKDGISLEVEPGRYAHQQTLGDLMGMWGSAFSVDGERLQHELGDSWSYTSLQYMGYALSTFGMSSAWPDTTQNFAAATVGNFTHGLSYTGWSNWWKGREVIPLAQEETISLVDGGFDLIDGCGLNLGIIPLLRPERKIDVIIICDSSGDLKNAQALRAAQLRAQELGLKFPEIDYTDIDKKLITVFEGNGVPTIIYIPGIANPAYGLFDPATAAYTSTLNFCYSPEQVDELSGLTEFSMIQNKEIIVQAIARAVDKKRPFIFC